MRASYRIEADRSAGLLDVTVWGFFELEDMVQLQNALLAGIAKLGRAPGAHVSLWDIRDCKIQSQDVVRMFRRMNDARSVVARRLAVVTGQSLMRMQIARILGDRESRAFENREPAIKWLLSLPNVTGSAGQSAGNAALSPRPRSSN